MNCPSYWKPEMSEIERQIKKYNFENHLVENRIFTADEISAYFIDALSSQSADALLLDEFYQGGIPQNVTNIMSIAANPKVAAESIAHYYSFRQEKDNIPESYDVSVERKFRYLPAQWHYSEYFTVCYCVNGECPVHFENETLTLQPGNVLVIAPNTTFAAPCYGDDKILVMYFLRATTFKSVFWDNLSDVPLISGFFYKALQEETGTSYLFYPSKRDEGIDRLLFAAYENSLLKQEFSHHMINGLMNLFFLLLFRKYNHAVRFSTVKKSGWKTEYLPILQYIQEHYADVTMVSLQKRFHYSDRQLCRIVKFCTGKSFSSLILELRMEKAKTLLLYKSNATADVAGAVGYLDVNAFYRAFHSYTGITPKQWRHQNAVENQPLPL